MGILRSFFIIVLSVVVFTACDKKQGSSGDPQEQPVVTPSTEPSFQVLNPLSPNDTAFLFPLINGEPQPRVKMDGQVHQILSQANFDRIMTQANRENVFLDNSIARLNNWALVSFRYTPCEFFIGQSNPCKEQLRFVFQPLSNNPNSPLVDYAIHVSYTYNETQQPQVSELMKAMVMLREEHARGLTDGRPLAPHPVLSNSQTRRDYTNAISKNIWGPFVDNNTPSNVTFMGLGINQQGQMDIGHWIFIFGKVDSNGRWQQGFLPDGSGHTSENLRVAQNGLLESSVTSQGETPEFNLFSNRPASSQEVAAIISPVLTNEHNTNCASCHTAGDQMIRNGDSRVNRARFSLDAFNEDLVVNGEMGTDLAQGLVESQFRGPNTFPQEVVTRLFGYMHDRPVIALRMSMDNAMAVKHINDLVVAGSSAPMCSKKREQFDMLNCVLGSQRSLRACVQLSCQQSTPSF